MNNDLPMPMDHQELTPHWYWNAISTGGQNPMQPAVPQTATQEFGVMVPSPVGAMEIAPGPGTSLPAMPCAPDTQQVFGVGVGEPEHMPPHWLAMPFALSTDQVFGVGNHEPMPGHVPAMPCAPSTGPGAWCRKY